MSRQFPTGISYPLAPHLNVGCAHIFLEWPGLAHPSFSLCILPSSTFSLSPRSCSFWALLFLRQLLSESSVGPQLCFKFFRLSVPPLTGQPRPSPSLTLEQFEININAILERLKSGEEEDVIGSVNVRICSVITKCEACELLSVSLPRLRTKSFSILFMLSCLSGYWDPWSKTHDAKTKLADYTFPLLLWKGVGNEALCISVSEKCDISLLPSTQCENWVVLWYDDLSNIEGVRRLCKVEVKASSHTDTAPPSAELTFNGSSVSIFGVIGRGEKFIPQRLTFSIDGNLMGNYTMPDIEVPGATFVSVIFFSSSKLAKGEHRIRVETQNGAKESMIVLDKFVYALEDTSTASSATAPKSSIDLTGSDVNYGLIILAYAAGPIAVSLIILICLTVWLCRRRSRQRRAGRQKADGEIEERTISGESTNSTLVEMR
ncbi:hypothetical protein DL96DRAFT_1687081 [Flagelloscypha sp. PMI_526]|nr:hypothetical protein DL96DRAFT_1687081 [Flagelloscypha sp. PMI_526]